MNIHIISLFPEELKAYFLKGIFKKALNKDIFKINFIDLRDYALDKHSKVDDYPFSDKQGMLLKADVIYNAVTSIDNFEDYRLIYTCPKGPVLDQEMSRGYLSDKGLIIIAGYYEGIDERIFELLSIERLSIGNFVLSSGELPALVLIETIVRQLPGVLGNPKSLADDSIVSGLLECPHYTQPRVLSGIKVPDVLLSGNHKAIKDWKRKESLKNTLFNKPEMLTKADLTKSDKTYLAEILNSK